MKDTVRAGLTASMGYEVLGERTVPYLLPESEYFASLPSVLATGYLVGLVESTCMQALDGHLDAGERTLGVYVDLSHSGPTPPGKTVRIEVELTEVSGRQLVFDVVAQDDAGEVCRGRHRRAVIDLERFNAKLAER